MGKKDVGKGKKRRAQPQDGSGDNLRGRVSGGEDLIVGVWICRGCERGYTKDGAWHTTADGYRLYCTDPHGRKFVRRTPNARADGAPGKPGK